MQAYYEKYQGKLMVITWLGETAAGNTPEEADLFEWIDEFGLEHMVSSGFTPAYKFSPGGLGLPSMNLIAPGGEVVIAASHVGESDITAVLPE